MLPSFLRPKCAVLGGGGHAKVVVEVLRSQGRYRPTAITDRRGKTGMVLGVPVVGDENLISELSKLGIRWFVVGVGGVPDNRPRSLLYMKGQDAGLRPLIALHRSATVARSSEIGPGTVVMPGAVLNPACRLGANVIANTGAIVEHDARIGDHVHLCPHATVSGGVEIGMGAFVGAGAVIREGLQVGSWAVIGAGAVVIRDVASGGRVAGVPARPMTRHTGRTPVPRL
jgi:UDP-perosamine 4-acetyltransferase